MSYPQRNSGHADSLEVGHEFQDFVCTELSKCGIILQNLSSRRYQFDIGENLQGFEIKLDSPCTRTGRLSIEIAEKVSGQSRVWAPSGINRGDNCWLYVQGNYERLFIFQTKLLRLLQKRASYVLDEWPRDNPTVRKFYLPLADAEKYAARVLAFTAEVRT